MTWLMNKNPPTHLALALAIAATCNIAVMASAAANPITGALGETKPIADVRLRYEAVDQEGVTDNANATTLRARLGAETGKAWNTSLLLEGEFLTIINDHYRADNSVVGHTNYPIVADPEAYEVNRFQFTNTSIANTTITLGRQRINLDDQRFIGNVGWRMNEQTFDALRVVNKPGGGAFTIDATYSNRVNRIYGPDSPQGAYKGDLGLINLAYQFSLGKLTAFDYLLHFDPLTFTTGAGVTTANATALNPARMSTQTWGLRFAGSKAVSKIKLAYAASYAKQYDYGDNPAGNFDNDYYAAELTGTFRQYTAGGGIETLGGDGTRGFSTPLATLHKFQGWADKFLTTPANGIKDVYGTASILTKAIKPFETVSLTYTYHDYKSERLGQNFGNENNLQLTAKYGRFTGMVKYAGYNAAPATPIATARDTSKFWAQLEYLW